jgi:MoaD family protein
MRITVRYSAQARQIVGRDSEVVELDAAKNVRDLLQHVAERHAGLRRLLLTDAGEPQSALLMFIDDEQIEPGFQRSLTDGAVISILPPIAGG